MAHRKQQAIAEHYGIPFNTLLREWYLKDLLSGEAIASKINEEVVGLSITSRAVYDKLKELGISRSKSLARIAGIKKGRVNYEHLKKSIKSVEFRRGISLGVRYSILKRDNFRCKACGSDASMSNLIIDHIIPVVHGGTNALDNL